MLELRLGFLKDSRNIGSAHGWFDTHESAVFHDGWRAAELSRGSGIRSSVGLLSLLALLDGRGVLIIAVLLAHQASSLEARVVNLARSLGGKTTAGQERCPGLPLVRRVEETDQAVGAANLLEVSRVTGLGKHLLGALHLELLSPLCVLGLPPLPGLLLGLPLEVGVGLLLRVVLVLDLADGLKLLALLVLELGALVAEAGKTLVCFVLLGLDDVYLGLNLVVLFAECLLLWVVHAVLNLLDLVAKVVNLLLLVVELSKVLAELPEVGHLVECLLLVHNPHGAALDLLLEAGDLAVHLLDALEVDLSTSILLLSDAATELLVKALDLVLLGLACILASGLLLTDLVGLCNQFLAALLRGVRGVLVLVGLSDVDFGLDGIL